MAVAAPVIVAEMADWVALGGGNSGIVGDRNHSYGFHLAADEVPASDYSRWRDPNGADGPYVDWSYACAGDFRHGGDPELRAMHARVLARLMRGELPMICEFIGQPYADQPVVYWARWLGVTTLQRYTGAGHDLWSHISWYRSRVDERAYLWRQEDDMAFPTDNQYTVHNLDRLLTAALNQTPTVTGVKAPDGTVVPALPNPLYRQPLDVDVAALADALRPYFADIVRAEVRQALAVFAEGAADAVRAEQG